MKIKKAIIPVAGKGTRFLPATKQTPKEMLPILNYPMIHYVVKEAIDSGIEQIIFINSSGKESIENYFDKNSELELFLKESNKIEMLDEIQKISKMVQITSIRQKQQLGLGHAINCAKNIINNETFAVLLGDDIIVNDKPVTKQLIDTFDYLKKEDKKVKNIIGVMSVDRQETSKYGIVDGIQLESENTIYHMKKMVEKPAPETAPTTLATPGRYILSSEIFESLDNIPKGAGGEYQLTDAINLMCKNDQSSFAKIFKGSRYDAGSLKGYVQATIDFALQRDDLKEFTKNLIIKKSQEL